jgi:glucan 1,3-beta-glucosidase
LINEPNPPLASSHAVLKEWYTSAIKELQTLDLNMPLYIGDCWRTDEYAEFIESLPGANKEDEGLVVLDHHLYRCFTASDIHTPAESHAQALSDAGAPTPQTFARVAEKIGRARCGGGLVIGEWSGALNPGSMTGNPGERRRYIEAQLGLYEKTCAGWFFWTFRKQGEGDAGWSFRDAVRAGVFPEFVGLRIRDSFARMDGEHEQKRREKARDEERDKALGRPLSNHRYSCTD